MSRLPLLSLAALLAACATAPLETGPALAQPEDGAPASEVPASGPDPSLEAISPAPGRIQVGLAGSDPADIARYLLARGASGATLSPDGALLAYSSNLTGSPQLWVVSATGGAPRQLTFGNGITFLRWLPDSSGLIYGADNDGNEVEAYFLVSSDGSEERLLLEAVEGGFRSFGDLSADGKMAVFASTERNGIDFDIYAADLETGMSERLIDCQAR